MSTYLYLECLDHDPPLRSLDESAQHLSDLPAIQKMVEKREDVAKAVESDDPEYEGYFERYTARFLWQHPKCRLRLMDEYGREHPLVADQPPPPMWDDVRDALKGRSPNSYVTINVPVHVLAALLEAADKQAKP